MIEIKHLRDFRAWIPVIAAWYYNEWPEVYPDIAFVQQRLVARSNESTFPIGLVAIEGTAVVGAVTLKEHEVESFPGLSPWLGSLIVPADRRSEGIGRILVKGVMEKAKELGFSKIYLFTDNAQSYYTDLGWMEKAPARYNNKDGVIMERTII